MKHRSVWKLIEKWKHKINTCLIIKLMRTVFLLITFQKDSPPIYFSHLLSHPHKKAISFFIWPAPTLLFTLASNRYREYSDDCGCNHSSLLNVCWTSVFGSFKLFLNSLSDHLLALVFLLRSWRYRKVCTASSTHMQLIGLLTLRPDPNQSSSPYQEKENAVVWRTSLLTTGSYNTLVPGQDSGRRVFLLLCQQ